MELEIKHLAPYLPYNLRFDNGRDYEKDYLYGIRANCYNVKMAQGSRDSDYFRLEKVKPVLRPLSDILNEIEYDDKSFVPMFYWDDEKRRELLSFASESYKYVEYLEYFIVEKLIEWHFDIFNLIPNGLAIDINTIKR
jgi:hypothetical protein